MLLVLVRHAKSSANAGNVLAGRTEGVHLDETGRKQADEVAKKFAAIEIAQIFGSPLVRCRETAEALCIERKIAYTVDERLNEVDYGSWSGKKIDELTSDPLWKINQEQPSAVTFPNGESMLEVFNRTQNFLQSMAGRGEDEVVLAFSHGDVIKALLASAYQIPIDQFQRIVVDPASISVVRLTEDRTFVLRVNESATTLEKMLERKNKDATIGGESS